MRAKSMALLMLALGCGLVASIGITQVMAKRNAEPSGSAGDTVPIFIAVKDINIGDILTAEILKQEPWPKDRVPQSALSKIEDVEGRRTRQRLFAGEPILENKLLGKGSSAQGASAVIPKGYRVVSVKVDSVSGSGLILPGDRVDVLVYLVGNSQKDIMETSTRTVLQDIKVFAVNDVVDIENKDSKDKSISAKTISLLVTPAQAVKVTLASELGKIRLVMRGPDDNAHVEDVSAKPEELLGRSAYADRDNETGNEKTTDDKKNLLDLLNQMKAKMAAKQTPEPPAASTISWTMRILQPDGINDVVLESDNVAGAGNIGFGHWRVGSSGITTFGSGNPAPKHALPTKKAGKISTPAEITPSDSAAPPNTPDTTNPLDQTPPDPLDSAPE